MGHSGLICCAFLGMFSWTTLCAQVKQAESDEKPTIVQLPDFRPESMLRVPATHLTHGKFPSIDIHTHFGFRLRGSSEQLEQYVQVMDQNHIAISVSLDAMLGKSLDEHRRFLCEKYPDRFAIFVYLDWQGDGISDDWASWDCHRPDFARRSAALLRRAKDEGACGVKFFKQFGLEYRNPDGSLIQIDDRRWDPIWEECGKLGLPVIIHTADPAAFFLPIDANNERYEELLRHPEWSFHGGDFPSRESLLEALNRVIERFPKANFVGAHVANNAEDLATVSQWLDRYPNLHLDTASRIAELGRQPHTAREFFVKYQDRILFGTDGPWPEQRLGYNWRFFETHDEYFPYSEKEFPPQGMWNIYGLKLPDDVLRKFYYENACRIVPKLAAKYERAAATLSEKK